MKQKLYFIKKVLNSKNKEEIWKMMYYCILNPSNEHDQFFLNNTAKGVTGKSLITFSDIRTFIKLLLDTLNSEQFMLHQTNSEKVLK